MSDRWQAAIGLRDQHAPWHLQPHPPVPEPADHISGPVRRILEVLHHVAVPKCSGALGNDHPFLQIPYQPGRQLHEVMPLRQGHHLDMRFP